MSASGKVVLLRDLADDMGEAEMRFRLVYDGELRPTGNDPIAGQKDPLAPHKQEIRRKFHDQLKHLWQTNKFLRETEVYPKDYLAHSAFEQSAEAIWGGDPSERVALREFIPTLYQQYGYSFLPLVRDEWQLLCSLDILFLRRDIPGSVISAGDIDNRLKTLIDALRRPRNALELVGSEVPREGETPFYCLLEDDKQVSGLKVETDTLLDPPTPEAADQRRVRVVITVELRPYHATMFSLSFV